jgi:membrane protein YqaA with SNARE-associated domain
VGAGLTAGRPPATDRPEETGRRAGRTLVVRVVGIVAVIALATWANIYAADHDVVREMAARFGYPGIFLAAAVSGFNLVVPIPLIAFFPFFMEIGFGAVPTVVVIALGMTTGDLVGYLIGRTTRELVAPKERGLIARLDRLRERHRVLPFVAMFLYAAFAPVPNEVLVIPLAFLRYPLIGVFTAVLAGNLIFNALVAFGILSVLEVF